MRNFKTRTLVIAFCLAVFSVFLMGSGIVQNVMTTLGDTIYGGANGSPTRLPGNTSTGLRFLSQTGNGTISAAPSWQIAPSAGFLTYYFTNTASSISTYLQMTTPPFTPKTTLSFTALPTGTDTLKNWGTNAGFPNLTFIPAGEYEFHVHALRSGGGVVNIFAEFWEVDAAGVDIALIGTSESSNGLTGSEVEYRLLFIDPNVYMFTSAASRVVARVKVTVSGSAPTVQIFVGGSADSHITLPSNSVDATNFVPYSGATGDVNLGTHSIIVNSCTGCGGGGSGTPGSTLFSATTNAGPSNSAAETTLIGSVVGSTTIPGNTFTNGAIMEARSEGFFSLPAVSDSLTLKAKCGSTVIGSATFTPGVGVLTNGTFRFWLMIAARGTGAGGSFSTNGLVTMSGSALVPTVTKVLNASPVAFDFTGQCVFDMTAQWGAGQSGESITGTESAAWIPGAPITSVNGDIGTVVVTGTNTATANKRGNSAVFQLAANNSAAAAGTVFCDDGSGNATTSGCTGGGTTVTFPSPYITSGGLSYGPIIQLTQPPTASWTADNCSSCTLGTTDAYLSLFLSPLAGAVQTRGYYRTAPTPPYTVYAVFDQDLFTAPTSEIGCGIGFRDSTGKIELFTIAQFGTIVQRYTTSTSYSADLNKRGDQNALDVKNRHPLRLAITDDGTTNITFYISQDWTGAGGGHGAWTQYYQEARGVWFTSNPGPTQIYVGAYTFGAALHQYLYSYSTSTSATP